MKGLLNFIVSLLIFNTSYGQERMYDQTKISSHFETTINNAKRGIKSPTGIIYYIEKDNRNLVAYKNDKMIWKTDIIAICGIPDVGSPEIRHIRLVKKTISVTFGKHSYATVDITNGKTQFLGSD